jgi:hypothetical protein
MTGQNKALLEAHADDSNEVMMAGVIWEKAVVSSPASGTKR